MGEQKHLRKIEELLKKSPVVDFSSIKKIVGKEAYAKLLIHNLISKKKIFRIAKGKYTAQENLEYSVFAFKPSYLGLQDALSHHGLWEQETIPVIITTRNVRIGLRKIMGSNVLIRRIENKYFFGIEFRQQNDFYLPYSDIEKTFIDMVYFKENIEKNVIDDIKKKIDKTKLEQYLKDYGKEFTKKIYYVLDNKTEKNKNK